MIAPTIKLLFVILCITNQRVVAIRGVGQAWEYEGQYLQNRMLLQEANDNSVQGGGAQSGDVCLSAGEFSRALLEVCIVSDYSEFVSLPSTYRTACCNLVEQYFSGECAGTCVAEEAMQQTNVWISVCRVNLPPLKTCTKEELMLEAPIMEQIVIPAIQAVQEAQEIQFRKAQKEEGEGEVSPSPSPQLQKDPAVVSSTQQSLDSLSSLALNTEIFQATTPPAPAPLIELFGSGSQFSSGEAQFMRAAPEQSVDGTQVQTYILPSDPQQQSPNVVMPLSIPILPSQDFAGFQQLKLLEAIQSVEAIKLFASAMIVNQALVDELQKPGFFTVFAPTDTAVVEFISTRSADDNTNLWNDAVVHHFVADKIQISSINGEKPLLMFDNKETVVERISTSVAIGGDLVLLKGCCSEGNFARVVVADVPVQNGMLHIVDRVLVPYSGFP